MFRVETVTSNAWHTGLTSGRCNPHLGQGLIGRRKDGSLVPGRFLRADDLDGKLGEENNLEWKTVAFDEESGTLVSPNGAIGYRWGEAGEWNLEEKADGKDAKLQMSLILDDDHDDIRGVDFPYFGGAATEAFTTGDTRPDILTKNVPVKQIQTAEGGTISTLDTA